VIQRVAGSLVLILLLATAAASAGTIRGVSGLIEIPSADSLAASSVEAGVHLIDGKPAMSITAGLASRLEVGLNTDPESSDLNVTMKGVVLVETRENPGMAVGYDSGSLYFVLSKAFSGLRGHVGFGDGHYGGLFGGISVPLTSVTVAPRGQIRPTTLLLLEYNGRNLSAGMRLGLSSNLRANLAIVDLDKAAIGLTYFTQL
jgi:hypothetical protein